MRQKLFWNRDTSSWEPHYPQHLARIHVIPDEADAFLSHADGKHYTSKSRYRAELRARGCEEVGNDRPVNTPPPIPDIGPDLRRVAWEMGKL